MHGFTASVHKMLKIHSGIGDQMLMPCLHNPTM
jgi:hypothetical protein